MFVPFSFNFNTSTLAPPPPPSTEGYIPSHDPPSQTWYRLIGNLSTTTKPPLIVLHGGPGAGHDYMSPLADIYTRYNIPIILYDQIGCGRSTRFPDRIGDEKFWTVAMFMKQVDSVVDHFNLRERLGFYLLGHSWGGCLAGAYASERPHGLRKVVLASAPASFQLYIAGTRTLLGQLPAEVRRTLEECERKGDYESDKYETATLVFMKRHVCRLDSFPRDLVRSFGNLKEDSTAYMTMQGPSEFSISGSLKNWEGHSRAQYIYVPTLLTHGRYDEVRKECMEPWHKAIPTVEWKLFENSAHMAHWEERERFVETVGRFLVGG